MADFSYGLENPQTPNYQEFNNSPEKLLFDKVRFYQFNPDLNGELRPSVIDPNTLQEKGDGSVIIETKPNAQDLRQVFIGRGSKNPTDLLDSIPTKYTPKSGDIFIQTPHYERGNTNSRVEAVIAINPRSEDDAFSITSESTNNHAHPYAGIKQPTGIPKPTGVNISPEDGRVSFDSSAVQNADGAGVQVKLVSPDGQVNVLEIGVQGIGGIVGSDRNFVTSLNVSVQPLDNYNS